MILPLPTLMLCGWVAKDYEIGKLFLYLVHEELCQFWYVMCPGDSLVTQTVKNLPAMQDTWLWPLGLKDALEKGMTNPLQYSCLENSMDWGAWRTAVHGVTKNRTQLCKSDPFTLFIYLREGSLEEVLIVEILVQEISHGNVPRKNVHIR